MDPARHRLTAPEDEGLLDRLAAELATQGDPATTTRRTTVLDFECATGKFMLRARVANTLMRVCGHDQWRQLFRPPDQPLVSGA